VQDNSRPERTSTACELGELGQHGRTHLLDAAVQFICLDLLSFPVSSTSGLFHFMPRLDHLEKAQQQRIIIALVFNCLLKLD
jgi:hypothetical protein